MGSDHDALEFVYQTYQQFKKYDADGDGEISWDEFYFYLKKSGYSLEDISKHWHVMDSNKDSKISFDEFWRGYKSMSHREDKGKVVKKPTNFRKVSKVIAIEDEEEKKTEEVLNAVKQRLRKSVHKRNESSFKMQLGKVLDAVEQTPSPLADDAVEQAIEDGLSFRTTELSPMAQKQEIGDANEDSKEQ